MIGSDAHVHKTWISWPEVPVQSAGSHDLVFVARLFFVHVAHWCLGSLHCGTAPSQNVSAITDSLKKQKQKKHLHSVSARLCFGVAQLWILVIVVHFAPLYEAVCSN